MVLLASAFARNRYFKAGDVTGDMRLRIKNVTFEQLGRDKVRKVVMWFTNDPRGLVLNKTNARTLQPVLGDNTEAWRGAIITVYPTTTTLDSRTVPCLRIRPLGHDAVAIADSLPEPAPVPDRSRPAAAAPAVAAPAPSLTDDLDDDF